MMMMLMMGMDHCGKDVNSNPKMFKLGRKKEPQLIFNRYQLI